MVARGLVPSSRERLFNCNGCLQHENGAFGLKKFHGWDGKKKNGVLKFGFRYSNFVVIERRFGIG